jgi:hypothetical protein
MIEIQCPNPRCTAVISFPDDFAGFQRLADEFCGQCDSPLFWAPAAVALQADVSGAGSTRRRLPGVGPTGMAAVGSRPCPECAERNVMNAVFCFSCGSLMDPPPPPAPIIETARPVFVVPAPQPVEPEPREYRWWLIGLVVVLLTIGVIWWMW